jgi:hypothetical protein
MPIAAIKGRALPIALPSLFVPPLDCRIGSIHQVHISAAAGLPAAVPPPVPAISNEIRIEALGLGKF